MMSVSVEHEPEQAWRANGAAEPPTRLNAAAIHSVVVFRALNLGDILCAIPALRALRNALPHAHIALVGLPSALPVLQKFPHLVDELIEFPGHPAFPEGSVRMGALPDFYRAMRARKFDLAIQMHGSGQQSNDIVRAFEASRWIGFVPHSDEVVPAHLLLWPDGLHEVHRYLALMDYVGVDASDDTLDFPVSGADSTQAEELIARMGLDPERLVFIHPGARLASRRWPLDRYRAVAHALINSGWQLAITGADSEKELGRELAQQHLPCVDLCGTTSLGVLASLLARARLLICNDTGVSHVAAGVHCPSVVIACGSDVARWRPLDTQRHTVLHAPMDCRPCAYDVCPIGHRCAVAVEVDDVLGAAFSRLQQDAP